jgi:hypothetical protein
VPDEDVAGLEHRRDRVAAVGERGALVAALAGRRSLPLLTGMQASE